WEKTLSAPGGGAPEVDVTVEGLGPPHTPTLITRLASTHFVPGHLQLLRIQLEAPCIVYPQFPAGRLKTPGPLSGPTCAAPTTCIQGRCQSGVVPPANLEAYAHNWPNNQPDRCKPANAGAPVLQIGTGQTDYLPLAVGQTLQ